MEFKNAQTDTLLNDIAQGAASGTLTNGNFGTPSGSIYLTFDYDVPAKYEVKRVTVDGTGMTSMSHISGANVAHTAGCKVGRFINAEVLDDFANGTNIENDAILARHISDDAMAKIYPVGSIYINATDNTNPATLLGFGTWVAFGAGRVPVGYSSGETEFNAAEKTGGEKTHLLTGAESGTSAHNHNITQLQVSAIVPTGSGVVNAYWNGSDKTTANSTAANAASAHNNLQPYITVYMWKRTA